MNRNIPVLGFILGVIFPMLGLVVMYFVKFQHTTFGGFINALFTDHKAAAVMLAFSLLANLIPFIYYTNKRLDHTAKGIFIATMLYAVLIVLLKFVWV